jgi:hypothetical protein
MRPVRDILRNPNVWLGIFFALAIAGVAVSEGPNVWHDEREQRRVERDPHVRGRVTGLTDTGEDNHGEPLVEVAIAFTTLEGQAIETRTIERVKASDAVVLARHPEIDVWYDPNDPFSAVIRFHPRKP